MGDRGPEWVSARINALADEMLEQYIVSDEHAQRVLEQFEQDVRLALTESDLPEDVPFLMTYAIGMSDGTFWNLLVNQDGACRVKTEEGEPEA